MPAGAGDTGAAAGALLAVELLDVLLEAVPEDVALVPALLEAVFPDAVEVVAAGVALALFAATVGIEFELWPPQATRVASSRQEINRAKQERSNLGETAKRKTKLLVFKWARPRWRTLTAWKNARNLDTSFNTFNIKRCNVGDALGSCDCRARSDYRNGAPDLGREKDVTARVMPRSSFES